MKLSSLKISFNSIPKLEGDLGEIKSCIEDLKVNTSVSSNSKNKKKTINKILVNSLSKTPKKSNNEMIKNGKIKEKSLKNRDKSCILKVSHMDKRSESNSIKFKFTLNKENNGASGKQNILFPCLQITNICPIIDVVFICDCTGSMSAYITDSKKIINQMIENIKSTYSNSSVQIGFISYRDHYSSSSIDDVVDFIQLTSDHQKVLDFISNLSANGGDDTPEAVVDALHVALENIEWRNQNSLRLLFHILDAPPHGSEFGSKGDKYPHGCPCNYDYKQILKDLEKLNIDYLILKCNQSVNIMLQIFKLHNTRIQIVDISQEFVKIKEMEDLGMITHEESSNIYSSSFITKASSKIHSTISRSFK